MWLDCQLSVYISYIRYKLVSDDLWYSAEGARELVMILDVIGAKFSCRWCRYFFYVTYFVKCIYSIVLS